MLKTNVESLETPCSKSQSVTVFHNLNIEPCFGRDNNITPDFKPYFKTILFIYGTSENKSLRVNQAAKTELTYGQSCKMSFSLHKTNFTQNNFTPKNA